MFQNGIDRPTFLAFLILAILLIAAGVIVYQDIDRLSESVYQNQKRSITSAMSNFRRDLNGFFIDLSRIFEPSRLISTQEDLETELIQLYKENENEIVSNLHLFPGPRINSGKSLVLDPEEEIFVDEDSSQINFDLNQLRSLIISRRTGQPDVRVLIRDDKINLVISMVHGGRGGRRGFRPEIPPDRPTPGGFDTPRNPLGGEPRFGMGVILLELEQEGLTTEIFPRLKENHFSGSFLEDIEVAIASSATDRLIFSSNSDKQADFFSQAEDTLPLTLPGGRLARFEFASTGEPEPAFGPARVSPIILLTRHRSGSLQNAVNRQRASDLFEAFGILALLGAAATTMLISIQKTRSLARRQLDFVAGISHELRNPLTALQSAGFNLSGGKIRDNKRIRKYGEMISRETRRLTQLVEQVMAFAGIEKSEEMYDRRPLKLNDLLERILVDYHPVFEDGWQVDLDLELDLPMVEVDSKAIESCLRNILDNALKYAIAGKKLEIKSYQREYSGKQGVELSIKDYGPGIPKPEIKSIFDPFYRGPTHVASNIPGAGLGLALVKRHIESHGGSIRVISESGLGTQFFVFLPCK
jgi:signal transduction histidine kinase